MPLQLDTRAIAFVNAGGVDRHPLVYNIPEEKWGELRPMMVATNEKYSTDHLRLFGPAGAGRTHVDLILDARLLGTIASVQFADWATHLESLPARATPPPSTPMVADCGLPPVFVHETV